MFATGRRKRKEQNKINGRQLCRKLLQFQIGRLTYVLYRRICCMLLAKKLSHAADSSVQNIRESAAWLSFLASNMQQEDVDILKAQDKGATCKALSINIINDTTATACYRVFNFMRIDTLGRAGKMTEQADYTITLVKRHSKWHVKMEGLLQSERQNRG